MRSGLKTRRRTGWRRFCAHVTREYKGDGYFNRMNAALQAGGTAPEVLHKLSLSIAGLLDYPARRIVELKGAAE